MERSGAITVWKTPGTSYSNHATWHTHIDARGVRWRRGVGEVCRGGGGRRCAYAKGGYDLAKEDGERVVERVAQIERYEDSPCEEGVHRADVVEHVLVIHREADEDDEKIEAPHHLSEADGGEVLFDVVVREVAKAGHPHVGRNVHADRVVDLRLCKVVIEDEHDLHPTLPLLRLVALERLDVGVDGLGRRGAAAAERKEREQQYRAVDAPEGPRAHILGTLGNERRPVAQVEKGHD